MSLREDKETGNHTEGELVHWKERHRILISHEMPFVPFEFYTINMYYLNVFTKNLKFNMYYLNDFIKNLKILETIFKPQNKSQLTKSPLATSVTTGSVNLT